MLKPRSLQIIDFPFNPQSQRLCLNTHCPSLSSFRSPNHPIPFPKPPPYSKPSNLHLQLPTSNSSNLRAFSYLLSTLAFHRHPPCQPTSKPNERCQHLKTSLKAFVLAQGTHLQSFTRQSLNAVSRLPSTSLKHLFLELFEALTTQQVTTVTAKYPIADALLIALTRAIVANNCEREVARGKIETGVLVEGWKRELRVRVEEMGVGEVLVEDAWVVQEEEDYTYVRYEPQYNNLKLRKQISDTKTTEQSQTSSQVFEKAKPSSEFIPPLLLQQKPNNNLISLHDIRQCSSKRTSFEQDRCHPIRPRQVISEIDESCQSSIVSCIIQRIEFRKGSSRKQSRDYGSSKGGKQMQPETVNMQKKVSQFTIASVNQNEDNVDEEVKLTLTDGTTSQAVLKLMSPSIAKVMDQKKKQSLRSAMQKYSSVNNSNNTNNQSSTLRNNEPTLRTSCNPKPITQFQARKSPTPRKQRQPQQNPVAFKSPKIVFTYASRGQSGVQKQPVSQHIKKSLSPLRVIVNQMVPKHYCR